MIGENLRKVIGSIILPKYPWIRRYEISKEISYGKNTYYNVIIIPTDEFYEKNKGWLVNPYRIKLQEEIKSLFDMLGPRKDQFFGSVEIPHKYD